MLTPDMPELVFFAFMTSRGYCQYVHGESEKECREKATYPNGEKIVFWKQIYDPDMTYINQKANVFDRPLAPPLTPRIRDRFLASYAHVLRDELNEFTEGSGLSHQCTGIWAGDRSTVVIKCIQGARDSRVDLFRKPYPDAVEYGIQYGSEFMVITWPSKTRNDIRQFWSDFAAYEFAGDVIAEILNARSKS